MKSAVIWVMCLIVVAASALVIADKIMDTFQGKKTPAQLQSAPPAHPTPADPKAEAAVLLRLEKVEKVLDQVRQMLQIPEPDPGMAAETRNSDNPGPAAQAGLGERLQWIESELLDLRKQQNRDLVQIFTRLRRRIDELEAKLLKEGAPDTRATVADLK